MTASFENGPRILVCFAVKEESQFFKAAPNVSILITGMGATNASAAITRALQTHSPALVITAGFAGGLNPALPLGAIVFQTDNPNLARKLQEDGAQPVTFHCAMEIAITVGDKERLREAHGADAVEMESQVIREICAAQKIPCSVIRVISDTASEDLPLDFNKLMTKDCRINFAKLIMEIIASPGKIPKLLAFRKKTIFAAQKLGEALQLAAQTVSA